MAYILFGILAAYMLFGWDSQDTKNKEMEDRIKTLEEDLMLLKREVDNEH